MKKALLLLISSVFIVSNICSQNNLSKKQIRKQKINFLTANRSWTAEIPLWIPGFAGTFAYGDVEIKGEDGVDPEHPIEPPPGGGIGEILSRLFRTDWYLKFFFITKIAYEKNNFLIQFDALSGSVGNSVKFRYNNRETVQANFSSTLTRLFVGYKIVNHQSQNRKFRYELFGYLGTRAFFNSINSDLNNSVNNLDISPSWWEPVIGLQNQFTFKRWFLVVQGDYGGLFVNTKYSNQFSFYTYYRTGKITSVKIGWNHLQQHHEDKLLNEDLKVIVTLSGPSVGIAFHF